MKKEMLTVSAIAKDLKRLVLRDAIGSVVGWILLFFMIWIITLLVNQLKFLFFVLLFCIIYSSIDLINYVAKIMNNKWKIDVTTVINSKEGNMGHSKWGGYKPYTIYFSEKLKFEIPHGENYIWSEMYSMSHKSIYNSTNIGDEFYIIVLNNTVVIAYNKKFFEFVE